MRDAWNSLRCIAIRPIPHYSRWGGYLQPLIFLAAYAAWKFLVLAPGDAIGFLAAIAVIMAVRADQFTNSEKVVWVILAFAVFYVEASVIHEDRRAHEVQASRDSAAQQARFEETLRGFRTLSVQNQANLKKTVLKINRAAALAEEAQAASTQNLEAVLGTDSYPCVTPSLNLVSKGHLFLQIGVAGKNTLTGVEVQVMRPKTLEDSILLREQIGTVSPGIPKPLREPLADTYSTLYEKTRSLNVSYLISSGRRTAITRSRSNLVVQRPNILSTCLNG